MKITGSNSQILNFSNAQGVRSLLGVIFACFDRGIINTIELELLIVDDQIDQPKIKLPRCTFEDTNLFLVPNTTSSRRLYY